MKIILKYRPSLELRDGDFDGTPLDWAIHGSENGWNSDTGDYAGTAEALIAAGTELRPAIKGSEAVRGVFRRHGAAEKQA